jgi:hypothetical protein
MKRTRLSKCVWLEATCTMRCLINKHQWIINRNVRPSKAATVFQFRNVCEDMNSNFSEYFVSKLVDGFRWNTRLEFTLKVKRSNFDLVRIGLLSNLLYTFPLLFYYCPYMTIFYLQFYTSVRPQLYFMHSPISFHGESFGTYKIGFTMDRWKPK